MTQSMTAASINLLLLDLSPEILITSTTTATIKKQGMLSCLDRIVFSLAIINRATVSERDTSIHVSTTHMIVIKHLKYLVISRAQLGLPVLCTAMLF